MASVAVFDSDTGSIVTVSHRCHKCSEVICIIVFAGVYCVCVLLYCCLHCIYLYGIGLCTYWCEQLEYSEK